MTAPGFWHRPFAAHLGIASPDQPQFLNMVGSADPLRQIAYMHELGFAGVTDNRLKQRSPEAQRNIGDELLRRGMRMGSFSHNTGTSWCRRDPVTRALLAQEMHESIEAAKRVSGDVIVVSSTDAEDLDYSLKCAAFVENLRELTPQAEANGFRIGLEPVSRDRAPNRLLRQIAEALGIINEVGSASVGLVFDSYHVSREEDDLVSAFERAARHVFVVQLADWPGRVIPGAGKLNFKGLISAIDEAGFPHPLELEHFPSAPGAREEFEDLALLRKLDQACRAETL